MVKPIQENSDGIREKVWLFWMDVDQGALFPSVDNRSRSGGVRLPPRLPPPNTERNQTGDDKIDRVGMRLVAPRYGGSGGGDAWKHGTCVPFPNRLLPSTDHLWHHQDALPLVARKVTARRNTPRCGGINPSPAVFAIKPRPPQACLWGSDALTSGFSKFGNP